MHIILSDGVAVEKSAIPPTISPRGLLLDNDVALSWADELTPVVQIDDAAMPDDFSGGKYLYQAGELVPNPAYVAPSGTPTSSETETAERYVTGVTFLRRFTPAQRIAARQLAKTDPVAEDFFDLLDKIIAQDGKVNLSDQDTVDGVNYLAGALPGQQIDPAVILS